jgi:hypothetical protein
MKQDRMKPQSDRPRTDMEPAEGSREKVRGGGGSSSERGLDDTRQSGGSKSRSGITNRDLEREEFEQDHLPERGQSSDSDR